MILILKPDIPSEILVEAVGIVANLTIDKFDFAKLVGTYPILPFIYKTLSKLMSQSSKETSGLSENDDVALELVRLVGTLSMDDAVIPMIAREHIPQLMTEFMVGTCTILNNTFL